MKRLTRKGILFVISSIIFILIIIFLVPANTALLFYEKNSNHLVAYLPLNKGDEFDFIFTHSIHLTDVVEKYEVLNDLTIKQYEIIFEEFGIGMPSNAKEGEEFEYINGKYHIKDLDNIFEQIKIRNGKTVSNNRLVWNENEVIFNDYFEPGNWYTVKVDSITLWKRLKGEKIHE